MGNNVTQKGPTTEEEALSMAMCLATSHVPSMVFKAVLELNIIDIINNAGPDAQLSSLEIASQLTTTNPDAAVVLDRLLRILANFTIVTFSNRVGPNGQVERVYGLGPVCQFLVKNGGGGSYTAFATLMYDKVIMDSWKHLKDVVLDGGVPFNLAHGMGVFDYLGTNSRFYNVFYDGMDRHSIMVSKKILDNYKGFEGIEHVGGDMYINVPKGDAIFMKWTFHTAGNNEQCIKLLKNCHEALPEDGKVIICEHVVSDEPGETSYQAHTSFIFDAMLLTIPGGRARTKHEYESLGKEAGFEAFRFVCFACDTWVMEFLKIKPLN